MDIALAPPGEIREKNIVANYNIAPPSSAPDPVDTNKKLIKNGEISFESDHLEETRKKILTSLHALGGYVAEENETKNNDNARREFVLTMRLPANNFDRMLDNVSADAEKIDSKTITIKDVSARFIDIKTQLANKKALENTYLSLLKKANKMGEVLQIEGKLTEIRTTIDSTQGELNYLSRQVAFSSLMVTFYNHANPSGTDDGLGSKFKNALAAGWAMLQSIFFAAISLWPFIILGLVLFVVFRRWRKNRST
jgi:hypothetical protein